MDLEENGNLSADKVPDFNTLSEIMAYFKTVPLETFKKNLNAWFMKELPIKRPDLVNTDGVIELPDGLEDLIENILTVTVDNNQSRSN